MNRFGTIIGALLVCVIAVAGCGAGGGGSDSSGTPPVPPTLKSISVSPSTSITPSTTHQFTASGIYSNGTSQNLTSSATWSSSNQAIATVNAGLVTAVSGTNGTSVITAVYSGLTGSSVLTTSDAVSLSVSPFNPPSIARGMTQQFAAVGMLANAATQILTSWAAWSSSDTGIAGINASGLASAVAVAAPGTTTISASFSTLTGTSLLTTSPVATITSSPSTASIPKGTSKQFSASGTLNDGVTHDLTTWATWSSSNNAIATISNTAGSKGLVTSLATGTVRITAAFDSVVSNPVSTLIVTPEALVSIAIAPTSQSLVLGRTQQYTATGTFTDHTAKNITSSVTWNSTNAAVALISNTTGSNGMAVSKSVGATTITASSSGITSNSATLTITPAELVSIEVTPDPATIVCSFAQTLQFTAMGTFTDGTFLDITSAANWTSSKPAVATVSKGLAKGGCVTAPLTTGITADLSGVTSNTAILTVTF